MSFTCLTCHYLTSTLHGGSLKSGQATILHSSQGRVMPTFLPLESRLVLGFSFDNICGANDSIWSEGTCHHLLPPLHGSAHSGNTAEITRYLKRTPVHLTVESLHPFLKIKNGVITASSLILRKSSCRTQRGRHKHH